ncbi:hypothetical protein [Winogradskyella helgolandensis]|uniref:hypothetical protein n=1 Tax=Winogradskyella helgolandensis TaxID=2697010 RepID=UPI0015C9D9E9|nr:hypothetical protein [Winogradskyella helgolandensis]
MNIYDLHKEFLNKKLNYSQAEQILHSFKREKRFEVFIALYNATLKKEPKLSFKVFREAYCASDNIYEKIKNSSFSFNLKDFLENTLNNCVNFRELSNSYEKEFYEKLENNFIIYRGVNQNEYESENFGISWSLSIEEAKKYICFGPNKIENGKGGILSKEIEKNDIITNFSVFENIHSEPKNEIIYINNGLKPKYEKVSKC